MITLDKSAGFNKERGLACIIVFGLIAVRAVSLGDPLLGWYEPRLNETAAIARNYAELDMNILYPRIDWGGNGPGFTEEAFQIYAYSVAILYKLFGVHEFFGRLISLIAFTSTALLVYWLGKRLFSARAGLFALFFFAIAPLGIYYGRSFQPDAIGLLFTMATLCAFVSYVEDKRPKLLIVAAVACSAAALTKPTNLFIGLPMLYVAYRQLGWQLFARPKLWALAIIAIGPTALWYWHANRIGIEYGNANVLRGGENF